MKKWAVLLVWLVLIALPEIAWADAAPPEPAPGSNLGPDSPVTEVRMMAETVLLDISAGGGERDMGKAQVTADFTMRNLGTETERMAARFPISANDGWFNYPEINNLQVKVNGKTVGTRRIDGVEPYYESEDEIVPWAEFDVVFPPGEDVNIHISYQVDGTGHYPVTAFNYILSTGREWKGTIGEADVILRLPYQVNPYNVLQSTESSDWFTSLGGEMAGNEIRWHFEDLEPTSEDNLRFELVTPGLWQMVNREWENLERNPNDGEAWGRLAQAYKESNFWGRGLRPDQGGPVLYELSKRAYEKCLELRPNDAEWHAGFAELHFRRYLDTIWDFPDYSYVVKAEELLKRAVEIDPKSPKALEVLESMEGYHILQGEPFVRREVDGYDFLLLTAAPPTLRPTRTLRPPLRAIATRQVTTTPTNTVQPTESPTETATATQAVPRAMETAQQALEPAVVVQPSPATERDEDGGGSLSVCGVTLILPLAGVVVLSRRRGKR